MSSLSLAFIFILGLFAGSFALADEHKSCSLINHECRQTCTQTTQTFNQNKGQRAAEIAAENQRYQNDMQGCRNTGDQGRQNFTQQYKTQLALCTTAACRAKTLNIYNINYNGTTISEMNCVAISNAVHTQRLNAIETKYPDVDYSQSNYQHDQTCRQDCQENYTQCRKERKQGSDSGGTGSSAGYQTKPCPPGSQANPLGVCVTLLAPRGNSAGTVRSEGCPPGAVHGPTDECVPKIRVVGVFHEGGQWYINCPSGTRPSPIDGGCVIDLSKAGNGGLPGVRPCPAGTTPGPDDACVPIVRMLENPAQPSARLQPGSMPTVNESLAPSIMRVDDPLKAIEKTIELLQSEIVTQPQ
ncbi:MAG: hypothetical protein GXP09_05570 [Gammaproteobacteria bacterium]|nr:hypothetical protein [Gammaproteobacteria bacterium]